MRVRPARALAVLALVLPVPLCTALGLSIPLPATVERIAANLVPFANTAALASKEEQLLGTRGSIVLSAGELAAQRGSTSDSTGPLTTSDPRNGPTGGSPEGRVDGPATASENRPDGTLATTSAAPAAATTDRGSSNPAQGEPSSSPTSPGGTTSTPDTGTTPTNDGAPSVVDTVTSDPSTVVATASNTVTTATQTATAAVGAGSEVINSTVGPVLPP